MRLPVFHVCILKLTRFHRCCINLHPICQHTEHFYLHAEAAICSHTHGATQERRPTSDQGQIERVLMWQRVQQPMSNLQHGNHEGWEIIFKD